MQIGGISQQTKLLAGYFFCTWIMATTLSMPVLCFSSMDRLNVAARNLDTLRIAPAIVLSRTGRELEEFFVEFSKLISEGTSR